MPQLVGEHILNEDVGSTTGQAASISRGVTRIRREAELAVIEHDVGFDDAAGISLVPDLGQTQNLRVKRLGRLAGKVEAALTVQLSVGLKDTGVRSLPVVKLDRSKGCDLPAPQALNGCLEHFRGAQIGAIVGAPGKLQPACAPVHGLSRSSERRSCSRCRAQRQRKAR
jgi:hypothetical protein